MSRKTIQIKIDLDDEALRAMAMAHVMGNTNQAVREMVDPHLKKAVKKWVKANESKIDKMVDELLKENLKEIVSNALGSMRRYVDDC